MIAAFVVLVIGAASPATALDMLRPGSDAHSCASVLVPGASTPCDDTPAQDTSATANELLGEPSAAARESEVDAFLAQWGKPPRAAVRALLDPSEANVAALLADQQQREARAAQVARQLTALQQRQAVQP